MTNPPPNQSPKKPEQLQTQDTVKKKVEKLTDDLEKAKEVTRQAAKQ